MDGNENKNKNNFKLCVKDIFVVQLPDPFKQTIEESMIYLVVGPKIHIAQPLVDCCFIVQQEDLGIIHRQMTRWFPRPHSPVAFNTRVDRRSRTLMYKQNVSPNTLDFLHEIGSDNTRDEVVFDCQ